VVLGISVDTPAENQAFRNQYAFTFPLLCDVNREVSMAYGACAFPQAYYTNRITYLIDERGIIDRLFENVSPSAHASELLALL
jgi:peroxiredoxin Q/BCP